MKKTITVGLVSLGMVTVSGNQVQAEENIYQINSTYDLNQETTDLLAESQSSGQINVENQEVQNEAVRVLLTDEIIAQANEEIQQIISEEKQEIVSSSEDVSPLQTKEISQETKATEAPKTTSFPIEGAYSISSYFGDVRELQLTNGLYYTDTHDGVDFVGNYGANILAWKAGTVIYSQQDEAGGEGIVIQHDDGLYSYYWHMIQGTRTVSVGERVLAGQVLGQEGASGYVTGAHLHFGISTGYFTGHLNPLDYL